MGKTLDDVFGGKVKAAPRAFRADIHRQLSGPQVDVNSPNWTSLGPSLTATGPTLSSTDYLTNDAARFYQAVRLSH